MNFFTKTILLIMTMSVLVATLQLLIKSESKANNTLEVKLVKNLRKFEPVLRNENENIPSFVSRYKHFSFLLWDKSSKLKMEL
ncbi:hypothetical protein P3G55_05005 [Leptospira sp. 96542]|nr:hypothetical protein [Leptospira sp. 96542]